MKCPECDGEMELQDTKKANMKKYVHKAGEKKAGCGVAFIPSMRKKGAVTNGQEEKTGKEENGGAGAKTGNGETTGGGGGYREAVRSAGKSGKRGERSNRQSAEHVPERRAAAASGGGSKSDQPAGGGTKRGWLSDVTDDIFGK